MYQPVISFIIPAYNAEKTILDCVDSILNCDYPQDKKEILIVNNNSNDRTVEILLKAYKNLPVIIFTETKQGRSYARNSGAKRAKGEILAFIDADCEIDRNWAQAIVIEFKFPRVGAVQGPIIPVPDNTDNLLSKFRFYQSKKSTGGTHILIDIVTIKFPMIDSATCAYRKTSFDSVGGFDVYLERHEDIDLSRRVFNSGSIAASCPGAISKVYWHGEGWKDFILRAVAHGRTQVEYEKKWGERETPLKFIYYIFCSKLVNLRKGNTSTSNLGYTLINSVLNGISYFSLSYYWCLRSYKGEKINRKEIITGKEFFFCRTKDDEVKNYYLSPNVNFVFLTNKVLIKDINRDLTMVLDEIYYYFFKEIVTGTKSSEELLLKSKEKYDIEKDESQIRLEELIASLLSHQMIELSA